MRERQGTKLLHLIPQISEEERFDGPASCIYDSPAESGTGKRGKRIV